MEQESQKRKLEETSREPSNTPILCANNCGFFGSASTNNLCSKCYKDFLLKQSKNKNPIEEQEEKISNNKVEIDQIKTNPVEVTNKDIAGQGQVVLDPGVAVVCNEGASSENHEQRAANRCTFCRKRVGLTGFKCRCEQTFCSLHRYSDKHNCVFDYKGAGQDAIAKANPVVKADKIKKI